MGWKGISGSGARGPRTELPPRVLAGGANRDDFPPTCIHRRERPTPRQYGLRPPGLPRRRRPRGPSRLHLTLIGVRNWGFSTWTARGPLPTASSGLAGRSEPHWAPASAGGSPIGPARPHRNDLRLRAYLTNPHLAFILVTKLVAVSSSSHLRSFLGAVQWRSEAGVLGPRSKMWP